MRVSTGIVESVWFLPAVITLAAVGLGFLLPQTDQAYFEHVRRHIPWIFTGSPSAARGLLSTIAASIITVISISFSITLLAFQQAANQYSSRVLRSFVRQRGYQVVLGAYIATFTYCLLVLRVIREPNEQGAGEFVPALSIAAAVLFALVCLGLLIYLISKVTRSIEAAHIIRQIHRDLVHQIDNLFPERIGREAPEPASAREVMARFRGVERAVVVQADEAGFVQSVKEGLLREAAGMDRQWAHIRPAIGEFVSQGDALAEWDPHQPAREEDGTRLEQAIRHAVSIGPQRSTEQDALFGFRQLVDVALKALSPSMNEATTAEYCVFYIGDALGRLGKRRFPNIERVFDGKGPVFVFNRPAWDDYVALAFEQVIYHAGGNPHVLRTILQVLERLARQDWPPQRRASLARPLEWARESVASAGLDPLKQANLAYWIERVDRALKEAP